MKKVISSVFLLVWTVVAFAQGSVLKQTLEIAEVEINDGDVSLSVFDMPEGDTHQYYLCVGTLGIGDDILQFKVPLGGTLAEAEAKMEEFKGVAGMSVGDGIETVGTLALANPSTGEEEPVYLTSRRFIFQRLIEFAVKRDGYVRATHIARSEFNSLLNGVKFYRKIHPNEP